MKIVYKDKWKFLFFVRYYFILENETGELIEIAVNKDKWLRFGEGDYYDTHYHQFYKYDQKY